MAEDDHITAHRHCIDHRDEIEASETCGCFHCLFVFPPSKIVDWVDDPGVTALCPKCGIDSVIGSASGYPISAKFLRKMKRHWFGAGVGRLINRPPP